VNFLSKAQEVTRNPNNADDEMPQTLKYFHTKLGSPLQKAAA